MPLLAPDSSWYKVGLPDWPPPTPVPPVPDVQSMLPPVAQFDEPLPPTNLQLPPAPVMQGGEATGQMAGTPGVATVSPDYLSNTAPVFQPPAVPKPSFLQALGIALKAPAPAATGTGVAMTQNPLQGAQTAMGAPGMVTDAAFQHLYPSAPDWLKQVTAASANTLPFVLGGEAALPVKLAQAVASGAGQVGGSYVDQKLGTQLPIIGGPATLLGGIGGFAAPGAAIKGIDEAGLRLASSQTADRLLPPNVLAIERAGANAARNVGGEPLQGARVFRQAGDIGGGGSAKLPPEDQAVPAPSTPLSGEGELQAALARAQAAGYSFAVKDTAGGLLLSGKERGLGMAAKNIGVTGDTAKVINYLDSLAAGDSPTIATAKAMRGVSSAVPAPADVKPAGAVLTGGSATGTAPPQGVQPGITLPSVSSSAGRAPAGTLTGPRSFLAGNPSITKMRAYAESAGIDLADAKSVKDIRARIVEGAQTPTTARGGSGLSPDAPSAAPQTAEELSAAWMRTGGGPQPGMTPEELQSAYARGNFTAKERAAQAEYTQSNPPPPTGYENAPVAGSVDELSKQLRDIIDSSSSGKGSPPPEVPGTPPAAGTKPPVGPGFADDPLVAQTKKNLEALTKGMNEDTGGVRKVTRGLNLENPYLSQVVDHERALRQALTKRDVLDALPKPPDEAAPMADKVAYLDKADEAMAGINQRMAQFRLDVTKRGTMAEQNALRTQLEANDIAGRPTTNLAVQRFDNLQAAFKEAKLGFDVSTVLINDLKAARVGSSSLLSSGIGHAADRISKALGGEGINLYPNEAISKQAAQTIDGLIPSGVGAADITRGGTRTPTNNPIVKAGRAVQNFNDWQYQKVGVIRQQIYEGRLYQSKLLGLDIADPVVRRAAADFANMATSTARSGTDMGRNLIANRVLLTERMTQSQFAEMAGPLKTFRSTSDALNTANQVLSAAALFGTAALLNKAVGMDPLDYNPLSANFGKMTLKATNADGKHIVWSFLPQFSAEKAVLQSISATKKLAQGSESAKKALGEVGIALDKYATGRLNVGLGALNSLGGFGYDNNGHFHYKGDMPLADRAKQISPLPLVSQSITDRTQRDPVSAALNLFGGNPYPEFDSKAQDRAAQATYYKPFKELSARSQAMVNVDLANHGVKLDDTSRVAPFWNADDEVFNKVKEANPGLAQYATLKDLKAALTDKATTGGLTNPNEVDSQVNRWLDQLGIDTNAINIAKRYAVAEDPQIVQSLVNLYHAGSPYVPAYPAKEWIDLAQQAYQLHQGAK